MVMAGDTTRVKQVETVRQDVTSEDDAFQFLKKHVASIKTTVGQSEAWSLPGAADFDPKTLEKQIKASSPGDRRKKAREIKAYVARLRTMQEVLGKLQGKDLKTDLDAVLSELEAEKAKADELFDTNLKTVLHEQRKLEETVRGLQLFFAETMIDNPSATRCITIANANSEEAAENFEALGSVLKRMADSAQLEELYDLAVLPHEFYGRGQISDLGKFARARNLMAIGEAPENLLSPANVDKYHDLADNETPFRHVTLVANRCIVRRASHWDTDGDVTCSPVFAFAGKAFQLDKGADTSVGTVLCQQKFPMAGTFVDWETKIDFYEKMTDTPVIYGVTSTRNVLHFDNAQTMAGRGVDNQYQNQRVLLFLKKVITYFLRKKRFSPVAEQRDIARDLEMYLQQLAGVDSDKMIRAVEVQMRQKTDAQEILGEVPYTLVVTFKDAIASFDVEIKKGKEGKLTEVA
jgi:hypothetical protein